MTGIILALYSEVDMLGMENLEFKKPEETKDNPPEIYMEAPKEVEQIIKKMEEESFEAYVVGGCVRDFLCGKKPNDWDVTTDAKPKKIRKIFPKSFYENKFGTVTAQTQSQDPTLKEIEITTFRIEEKYTDMRHPDEIKFTKILEEDLKRRDFTVNAMALKKESGRWKVIDYFGGQQDLKDKIIRAVGNPEERFKEDALRLMRAIRFATTLNQSKLGSEQALGWQIEPKTFTAIKENSGLLNFISKERVRDELSKIIMSKNAAEGIELLRKTELLKYIIPEILEGYGIGQNKHHIYEVYEHSLRSLNYAAKEGFSQTVRIAALFHDIGKPRTKRGEGPDSTFYGHEVAGAKMTLKILERLRFSKKEIEKIAKLVRYHLFYYNTDEVGESSVRRLIRQVGPENMGELLQVRMADRIGSGVPKAEPYKLRHLKYIIEKVSRDPISVKMLKVSGNDIMEVLGIKPGPKIGMVLDIMLGEVLENPEKNEAEYLRKKIKDLGKFSEEDLKTMSEKARSAREKLETKKDEMTKKKYWLT